MSSNLPATTDGTALVEQVVVRGDLSALTPDQKSRYYVQICESLGLNPYTQPFGIYKLNSKEIMYAKKDAAEQLRKLNGISVTGITRDVMDGVLLVTVSVRTKDGREDTDVGAVPIQNLKGTDLANAIMKAITKGKRRATLSISGLGMLDETEVETIPGAAPLPSVTVDHETGEIVDAPQTRQIAPGHAKPSVRISDGLDTPHSREQERRRLHGLLSGHGRRDPHADARRLVKLKGYDSTTAAPFDVLDGINGWLAKEDSDTINRFFLSLDKADAAKAREAHADFDTGDDPGLSDDEIRQIGVEIEAEAAPAVSGGAGNDQWSN